MLPVLQMIPAIDSYPDHQPTRIGSDCQFFALITMPLAGDLPFVFSDVG